MRAGLLSEVITIMTPYIEKDEYGSEVEMWDELLTTRANVRWSSGNRSISNDEIVNVYSVDFTIRRYHDIDEVMRVRYEGKLYRILSIEDNRHDGTKKLRCELINE